MRVLFIDDEYGQELHSCNLDAIPRIGDAIHLDEEWFVSNVVWDIKNGIVTICVSDSELNDTNEVQIKEKNIGLHEARMAGKDAKSAIKMCEDLNRDLFSLRQIVKSLPKAPVKKSTNFNENN